MTPKQFADLLTFIKENNSWGLKMYEVVHEKNRRAIKYVDASFDSRDGTIWQITFREVIPDGSKTFQIKTPYDVAQILSWLNTPIYT